MPSALQAAEARFFVAYQGSEENDRDARQGGDILKLAGDIAAVGQAARTKGYAVSDDSFLLGGVMFRLAA